MCSKDAQITIDSGMQLDIKETRSSSTAYEMDGNGSFSKVTKGTATIFVWRLSGIASKLSPESDDFDAKGQEIYNVSVSSTGYDLGGIVGFDSRERAIKNALEYAKRNGIKVDGYKL